MRSLKYADQFEPNAKHSEFRQQGKDVGEKVGVTAHIDSSACEENISKGEKIEGTDAHMHLTVVWI